MVSKSKRSVVTGKPETTRIPLPAGGVRIETFIPWTLIKRGVRREVVTPTEAPVVLREELLREPQQQKLEKHSPLLRSLGLAHYWQQLLDDSTFGSITEIAAAEGMDVGRVSRMLQLAQLSPANTSAVLTGTVGCMTIETASRRAIESDWRR